jgi:hypothetical protein
MSHTVPAAEQPAVVLRSQYKHLRALLAIAGLVIAGLTVAVVVLATSTSRPIATSGARVHQSAIRTNSSAETGARLDHRGLRPSIVRPFNGADYPGHY